MAVTHLKKYNILAKHGNEKRKKLRRNDFQENFILCGASHLLRPFCKTCHIYKPAVYWIKAVNFSELKMYQFFSSQQKITKFALQTLDFLVFNT
jgi:hypothetical protein